MFMDFPLSRLFAGPLWTFHVGMDPSLRLPADVWGLPVKYRTVQNPQKKL